MIRAAVDRRMTWACLAMCWGAATAAVVAYTPHHTTTRDEVSVGAARPIVVDPQATEVRAVRDARGRPHVLWRSGARLRHATRGMFGRWQIREVATLRQDAPAGLRVASASLLAATWRNGDTQRVAIRGLGGWKVEALPGFEVGARADLAVSARAEVVVISAGGPSGDARRWHHTRSGWRAETMDPSPGSFRGLVPRVIAGHNGALEVGVVGVASDERDDMFTALEHRSRDVRGRWSGPAQAERVLPSHMGEHVEGALSDAAQLMMIVAGARRPLRLHRRVGVYWTEELQGASTCEDADVLAWAPGAGEVVTCARGDVLEVWTHPERAGGWEVRRQPWQGRHGARLLKASGRHGAQLVTRLDGPRGGPALLPLTLRSPSREAAP